jgi:hypothetical protein
VPKPTLRRFFRYRLRTLLALVFVVAVGLGVYRHFHEQQRRQREFMIDAIPLGAKFTIKRWLSDHERECTTPAEVGMMDDIVSVDLFGTGWFPWRYESPDESIGWPPWDTEYATRGEAIETRHMVHRLRDLPGLKRLCLQSSTITDQDVARLGQLTQLEHLNLCGADVTIGALPHIGRLTRLRRLSLGYTKFSDVGLKYLADLKELEVLDLGGTDVFDVGLADIRQFRNLTHLYLYRTQVRYVNLSGMPALKYVDLSNTPTVRLYLDGSRRIRTLDLGATGIKRDQLQRLADLPSLERLSLHNLAYASKDLAVLHQLPGVEEICVDAEVLDSDGLRSLRQHPALKTVHVNTPGMWGGSSHMVADQVKEWNDKVSAFQRALHPLLVRGSHRLRVTLYEQD